MLSWMLYAVVVSLLMGLAALALERSAQIRQRPARWLWGTCMVASLAILFIPSRVSVQVPETTHADRATSSGILTPPQTTAIETSRFTLPIIGTDQTPLSNGVSTLLDWTWRVASMALALVIPRRWRPFVVETTVAGTAVIWARDGRLHIGGYRSRRCRVFTSTYCRAALADKLSPDEQELVIAHERSHLGAYDTPAADNCRLPSRLHALEPNALVATAAAPLGH